MDESARSVHLAAHAGLPPGGVASPVSVDLAQQNTVWSLAEVVASGAVVKLNNLHERFGDLVCGPYPEPITLPGHKSPACIMVAGVSTRLPMNEEYLAFYDQLAATVTIVIVNATAKEEERKRSEALAELDRAKTTFFSNVSHEFRTPLTLLLGPLEDELAESTDALPLARRACLETAHRNSLRLLKLVNTLLDFSRIEAGRAQAVYEPTDLAVLTTHLAGNFRSVCEHAGLQLNVHCPPLHQPVYVDQEMWEKIVLNLGSVDILNPSM